ncbi:MAG: LacI family DNA-binding transcriptional regulator [Bacteroidales bacterium]
MVQIFLNKRIINERKKITITDIARLAGVSIGTVDRVIHERGQVSRKTRDIILKIIQEVNFSPDILASMLASKKTYRFIILIPEYQEDSSFWKSPLSGMKKAVAEVGHYGINADYFFFDQFDSESFRVNAEKIIALKPDGLLFAPVQYKQALELAQLCDEHCIPFVFINSNIEELNYLSYIGQNSVQSGYLSAKLMSMGFIAGSDVLVVNISRQIANHRHIIKRNKGFEDYFHDHPDINIKLHILNIENTCQESVNEHLDEAFGLYKNIFGIYVPSSRVYKAAKYLNDKKINRRLIGYDLIEENISYLKNGIIDFLISQKPVEQGYHGIMALFNHLVLKKGFKKNLYLPIDIITSENLSYYLEF